MNIVENKLATLVLIVACYVAGRLHQWYRNTDLREWAYRGGYADGSKSTFETALRTISKIRARGTARVNGAIRSTTCSSHSSEARESRTVRINSGDLK